MTAAIPATGTATNSGTGTDPDPDSDALVRRLGRLRDRVALLVEHRSASDPTAADPLRGLYLTDEAVRHLLRPAAAEEGSAFGDGSDGAFGVAFDDGSDGDRLHQLAARLGLSALDARILLTVLAPDLDRTFEPLYGYLNDDVSRRRATIGLALDLCGVPAHRAEGRARFHPSAPLAALGLIVVEEGERPFLSRSLRVPDRVAAHLVGDDTPDPALAGQVRPLGRPAAADDPLVERLAKRLATGPATVYLREQREGDGIACAAAALGAAALPALHFTPAGHSPAPGDDGRGDDPAGHGPDRGAAATAALPQLLREARLRGHAVLVAPVPDEPGAAAALVRALAVDDVTVIMTGTRPYDPQWADRDPLVLDAPRQRAGDLDTWTAALGTTGPGTDGGAGSGSGSGAPTTGSGAATTEAGAATTEAGKEIGAVEAVEAAGFDLAPVVAPYRLGGDRIRRVARVARELAEFDGTPLSAGHLRLAARQQSASGLERHARRIRPAVGWDDLVLPDGPLAQLRELAMRARHRDQVLGDWRLSAGGGRGRGVLALFAGGSGTGKTLSAEVVAAELGLDLYVVQLSSIVDKYVGETEKNLERVFTEADRTDAVLLFDEADSVFGKRSEVKDAHDRYANMESAYLLQRLESFDGIALLTTNLRANVDDAFTRRLDMVVDFPFPDPAQRLALWRHSLAHVPCADDIEPDAVARQFELAGGSIRSAVVTAAYAAAGRGAPVGTADLLAGAQREYRKAGRLVLDDNGEW
ncbi:ATP-binding protein [Streptomyces sp. NBC_00669]|uniref:ATP-binding protein n=1 Tax=Streptomyces sp. NBC_00669 TaxID=2976011 RepID=UPI003FA74E11